MTRHDALEADLFAVFDDDAQAPIPAGGLERLHAAIADQQPRPARLAGLGSRWVADPSATHAPLGALRARVPVLRLSAALLLLLLTLALIGTAASIGGRLLERPTDPGKLLYELGGGLYLADADGGNPTSVADGAVLFEGSTWAPDGRHFVSFDTTRLMADIRDRDGHMTASFANLPGFSGYPVWSPDSTRLQTWTQSYRQIDIYGIDGVLQAELPVPEGYTRLRENLGVWAPDGRSVWVRIAAAQRYPCTADSSGAVTDSDPPPCAASEVWALPIDGSEPQRLADDHPFARGYGAFSRDGRLVASVIPSLTTASTDLVVANADGSDARTVATGNGLSGFLQWSPDGEHLASYSVSRGSTVDLVVLELATGTLVTAVPEFSRDGYPPFSWSSDSDRLLFAAPGDGGDPSLWSVNVDGTGRTLVVQGATRGAMPAAGPTDSSIHPPAGGVDSTPSPAPTPPAAGDRPGASLIRIAGHDVSVVLPDGLAGRLPADGDVGNGIMWGNGDDEVGRTGSRWRSWSLYAPGDVDDPSRSDDSFLPLPADPVAWLRRLPGVTVLQERDIEVGGQPGRLLDVVRPEGGGGFSFEVPVGDSGATRAFVNAGGTYIRLVIWQLGSTWMVAQATANGLGALETADAPDDLFMRFIADLRLP